MSYFMSIPLKSMYQDTLIAYRQFVEKKARSRKFDLENYGKGLTHLQKGFMEAHLKSKGLISRGEHDD